MFLIQQGLDQIAGISPEEEELCSTMAARSKKSFPRQASACLDRARLLIDRNVNQKILFCDLVVRMYSFYWS